MTRKNETTYVTTPIYYVNDKPHIGHCYTSVIADVITRSEALLGKNARMQTGTDEHGQKVAQSAAKNKQNTMLFCNSVSAKFYNMTVDIDCCSSYETFDSLENFNKFAETKQKRDSLIDTEGENQMFNPRELPLFNQGKNYIRTTEGREIKDGEITGKSLSDGRHIKFVQNFWLQLQKNGWIFKNKYCGWYCIRDEAFYAENELVDGKAPTGAEVEWKEEECYFFKLSVFQKILFHVYSNRSLVKPAGKNNEILSFLSGLGIDAAKKGEIKDGELTDLCISRENLTWGVPVPNDDKQHVYVWLDALTNYISALDGVDGDKMADAFWQTQNKIHVIGKDIIRFHAVYWPAFLIAHKYTLEEIESIILKDEIAENIDNFASLMPNILVHGWWTNEGQKISKSLGNSINPYVEIEWLMSSFELTEEAAKDYLRYFLCCAMRLGSDGDYSRDRIVEMANANLANNLGNLINRTIKIIQSSGLNFAERFVSEYAKNAHKHKKDEIEKCLNADYYSGTDVSEAVLSSSSQQNANIEDKRLWSAEEDVKMNGLIESYAVFEQCLNALKPIMPSLCCAALNYIGNNGKACKWIDGIMGTGEDDVSVGISGTGGAGGKKSQLPVFFPRLSVKSGGKQVKK